MEVVDLCALRLSAYDCEHRNRARIMVHPMPHQAVDFAVVLSIGAALPDVKDASGSRGPALKIKSRLLACKAIHKSAEPDSLMVRINRERREELLAQDPEVYYLTDHYAPYPAILVRLPRITRTALKKLLTECWQLARNETGQ